MSNRRWLYAAMIMAAVLTAVSGCSTAANAALSSTPPNRTITVVGNGKASGTPDVARVTVGIETRDESVQVAAEENNATMSELLQVLKGMGIADKDIQTTNYSVYADRKPVPVREPGLDEEDEAPIEYVVSNQVMVTVRDLTQLGQLLDEVVIAGANSVYGIRFTVDDPSELEAEARADAMADAVARAESLAELADVQVGDVLSISEVIGGAAPYAIMESARGLGGATAPIEVGELEVGMSVQVTYAIR